MQDYSKSHPRLHPLSRRSLMMILSLCLIGNLFLLCSFPCVVDSLSATSDSSPDVYMMQGLKSFKQGTFEPAVRDWQEAARLFEKEGRSAEQSEVLILLSQAYQSIGLYNEALKCLQSAQTLAEKSGDRVRMSSLLGSLGNLYITIGPMEKAYQYLNEGLAMARDLGNFGLVATILNDLGNLYTTQKKFHEAIAVYLESASLAEKFDYASLAARSLTNAAMTSMQNGQHAEAKTLLDRALDQIRSVDRSHEKAYGLVNLGLTYYRLRPYLPESNDILLRLSSQTFQEALVVAASIGDSRAASYAYGYLGKLYEDERRYPEALSFTNRATFAAQQVHAPESLYLWQWQTGRLLKALAKMDEALSSYRNSVQTLESMRQEMPICYGGSPLTFRESVEPIFFGFVDLLLQRAASLPERKQFEPYLMEARETIEMLKIAELRDYFQDQCVAAARSRLAPLDIVSKTAVVVYPIVLPDRMELLVSLPAGLKRYAVPIGADTLTQEIRQFRWKLENRTTREYLPHAQKLYDWLIRPLEADLKLSPIDTLVFVPDGPLRIIPMSALHDGQEFLINKYAIAVTPGLNLADPRPLKRENIKVLAAGLTDSVQGFPPLPDVSVELQTIQGLYGGNLLLNRKFFTSNLEKELKNKQFTVVHIASHGQFESDIHKTFVLTFDDKLTMDQLDQYVGSYKFREDPLELLTLSACETAVGDDRAALGLAGVAIKAGARSAVATLWHINDQVSSALVVEFYRQLQSPSISRAIALQRAQMKLLHDRRYRHPGYWSPFLLINNWL